MNKNQYININLDFNTNLFDLYKIIFYFYPTIQT